VDPGGRRTGRRRVTPLQFEGSAGRIVVASARGRKADWVRTVLAEPAVEVRVGKKRWRGVADVSADASRIADFLELRLERHRRSVGAILRLRGLHETSDRAALEEYAARLAVVTATPRES
jgi:deazaflavin-dependent oxidoreductase (nitroreductase family)